jgi:hypothetical protein
MSKRTKTRAVRQVSRPKAGGNAKAMPQLMSPRTSRIIVIAIGVVVILLMIMAMLPGSLSAPGS